MNFSYDLKNYTGIIMNKVSLTRPFSRKERSGWADSHFFYFFKPITIVMWRCNSNGALAKILPGETGFGVTRPQKYRLQDANHGRKMATSPQDQTPQKLVKDVLKTATQPEVVGRDFSGWLVPPNERLIYAVNFRPLRLSSIRWCGTPLLNSALKYVSENIWGKKLAN